MNALLVQDETHGGSDQTAQAAASPELQAESVVSLLQNASGHRLALLHLLSLCLVPRSASFLDEGTNAFLQGQISVYAPVTLRQWLVDAGGLARVEVGEGERGEDEWQTTPAGKIALEKMNLSRELTQLLDESAAYREIYLKILRFCTTPRDKQEIEDCLKGDLSIGPPRLYPQTFFAALEQTGALRWMGKWTTTELGRQICQ